MAEESTAVAIGRLEERLIASSDQRNRIEDALDRLTAKVNNLNLLTYQYRGLHATVGNLNNAVETMHTKVTNLETIVMQQRTAKRINMGWVHAIWAGICGFTAFVIPMLFSWFRGTKL